MTARILPADFRGAHYIEYDIGDLQPSVIALKNQLQEWKSQARADFVKGLYY